MKVSRPARIAFLFLVAFLLQTDRFTASAATVPPDACLYALDSTADRAFQIAGAQSVYTACGVVVESRASDGFETEGTETLYLQNHAQVSVVGGAQLNGQTYLWDTIGNKQVQPVKVSSPGDPLASIAPPATGTIVSKSPAYFDMNSKPTNNTLSPGVYCGGLTIGNTNGTAFTLSPGVYIMAGGGLVMNSQAVVHGAGITIYNTSSSGWGCSSSYNYAPITISGQVTATLSAPTSGALNGILFFGNRTGCSTKGSCVDQINGGSTAVLNGALYFASDEIEITGSNASGYTMLVADKIYINGSSTFGNNGNPFDGITVTVSPATAALAASQTQQFAAILSNTANTAVTWSISPSGVGAISASGLYTAPSIVASQETVTITATSQADDTKLGTATVTLMPPIVKTTPVITWPTQVAITYGTALSAIQLDATTTVAGTFVYTPAAGTVLTAGTQTLSVIFTPTDTTDYNMAAASVALMVNKATPTITWATPAAITYGTALSAMQLDATASAQGTFFYTPAAATVLPVGTQTLSVTFTPTDATDYNTPIAKTVSLTVTAATQTIAFTALSSPVTYGVSPIALSATASSGLPVTFSVVSGPGSVSGSTLTITGAGTVVVAANQAGNGSYAAAPRVTQSIFVDPALLTVTATSASRVYGAANPSLADTITGFVNGDSSSVVSGAASLTTTATTASHVGSYPITVAVGTLAAANYSFTFVNGTLTVGLATPTITWVAPAAITYGTALSSTQLNATANVGGAFVYAPAAGAVLTAGAQTLSVTFTPTDTTDYAMPPAKTVPLTVNQAMPVITWPLPAAITYGTALSAAQLDATTNVQGTFAYTPAAGAILPAGPQTLSVTFTPTDMTDYATPAAKTVPLAVGQVMPVIAWAPPVAITYGTALSAAQLDANSTVQGAFVYSPVAGTQLPAGSQTLSVAFTPTDTIDYTTPPMVTVPLTVNQAMPVVTWAQPAAITYGTVLSATQLDATASVPGTLVYTPAAGTILPAGFQTLSVTFTPTDTANYATPAATIVSLAVNEATQSISFPTIQAQTVGTPLTLSAAATSGLPVSFVSTTPNVCAATGATATFVAAGTCTIQATQAGNTMYAAAAPVTQSFTVNQASQCASSYQRAITIDHTKVPNTDQVNFPFLFNTTDPTLATIANGGHVFSPSGNDIIFSADPNGTTTLAYELEEYDPVHGQVIAWVRIPNLSHTANTVIYMFYGDSSITTSQQNPLGVWSKNYQGVWHLDQSQSSTLSSVADSTINSNNGVIDGSPAAITGEIGGALDFIGNGDNLSIRSIPLNGADYTISAWFTTPLPTTGSWNTLTRGVNSDHQVIVNEGNWHLGTYANQAGGFQDSGFAINSLSNGWHYLAAAATGNTTTFYIDGAQVGTIPFQSSADIGFLGNYQGGGQQFGGVDEIRVSTSIARSADWVATEYNNQSSSSTFYALTPENSDSTISVTPAIVSLYAAQNQSFAMLGMGTCSSAAINWTIDPADVGTISQTGLYSSPGTILTQQTVTVTASNSDSNISASSTITLLPSSSGPAGTVITINGAGFGGAEGPSSVTVGGHPAVTLFWSDTQIQVQIPTGTGLGNQDVVVNADGQSVADNTFDVTPGIVGITPPPTGASGSVTFDMPGQTAPLIFNGTAGQLAVVVLSNSTLGGGCNPATLTILNPNGSTLTNQGICNGSAINPVTLPTTGVYSLVIVPYNTGATGSATVTLWVFNEQTGAITSGVPKAVSINIPAQEDLLTFSGNAGQLVSVLLSNSSFSGGCNPVTFVMVNPDRSTLANQGICNGNATNTFVLPSSGTYMLVVTPYNNAATGSGTVTLWVFSEQTGTITSGIPVNSIIEIPGQNEQLTFNAVAGQLASVLLSNSTFSGGCNPATITILNPNGSTILNQGICNGNAINPVVLPITGTYTLIITPYNNGATGSATVTLWVFNEQTGTISPGVPKAITIDIPGQEDLLTFSGTTGQTASVQLSNSTFGGGCNPATVDILSSNGSTLVSQTICNGNATNTITLPVIGSYTVEITPYSNGATGSATGLLTLSNPTSNVTVAADLVPTQSRLGYPVAVDISLTTKSGVVPTGTVGCSSGSGAASTGVPVSSTGSVIVQINGLPLGNNAIVCSFISNNPAAFLNAVSPVMTETVVALPATGSVTITPPSATLYSGQTQQFTASVLNTSNQSVTWFVSPSGTGTISPTGLYATPATISAQQTVVITATSQADSTQSGSATVTLVPTQCGLNGYSYQRTIVIDHTKVPNTDQTNFPFLFNTTDPLLATTANGGHITSPNGYDIIFTSDPAGQNVLSYEMGAYNPVNGQVIAWVQIPTLSHGADTVLYMFYGNSGITTSQQNSTEVWDSNYGGVWHLDGNGAPRSFADSTANANNATVVGSVTEIPGEIGNGAALTGSPNYIDAGNSPSVLPTHTGTFSLWVNYNAFANWTTPMGNGDTGNDTDGAFFWNYAGGQLDFEVDGPGGVSRVSGSTLVTGQWYYLTGTWDGSTVSLYKNGALVGSTAQTTDASPAYHLTFGIDGALSGSGNYLNGGLGEARVSGIARSADWVAAEYSNQSSPSTFYTLHSENAEMVVPTAVKLYASQSQQFAATGTCNSPTTWSMPSDAQGTLTTGGVYTAPSSISTQQTIIVTASSQGSSTYTGTALVTLLPPPLNPTLTLTATAQPPYVVGTVQAFAVILKNESGTPIPGETVNFTVSGANSNTGSGTTDANGIATYNYTGVTGGTDTIQAAAIVSGEQVTSNTISAVWIVPVQAISTTTVTGEFFLSDGCGCFDTSPDAKPVFVQSFPVINFNPPQGTVPGNTSTVNVDSRPFTDVTTDLNGNFTGTIIAQGNGYQAGVNNSVGQMETFQVAFFGSYTVASAGDVVFNFYNDDGFDFGIGNGATRVSGSILDMPAVTTFAQYPSLGAYDVPTSPNGETVIVNFPAPGVYPYEVDYSECCGGQLVLTVTSGATNPTGIPPTGSLTLTPNSVQPLPIGGQQAFTVLASDASGAPAPNVKVGLVVTGVDNLQLSGTTDATGHATIVYQDVNPGSASVQALAFISGMATYSNMVSVPWTLPPAPGTASGGSGTLSIGISALNTVALPSVLQLNGTASDGSLPAGSTPAITWSQLSGPGTVAFTTSQQTVTNGVVTDLISATFSQPGNYVLQLSASDSQYSGSLQWPVAVSLPETDQGWVGSPAFGSTVSGLVPITLAPGVSLQSGILTYSPANNSNSVTVLNGTVAGSGQIGTLDTTTLANGSYTINLQGTDTNGNVEYSIVEVTVAGNFKPGRVTATVTDLVVPATGLPINIQRTYDSLNAGTSSDFGYGWNLGINVNLVVDPKGNVTFTLGGQRKTFYLAPSAVSWVMPFIFVYFTPEPGLHGTLTDSGSGCADGFDILAGDGFCIDGSQYNPPGYIYTDPNGTAYTISAAGNLQSINDRSGNGLTITPNGITSTTGLSVPFVRDAQNRITQITDPQGNIYQYGYDANGNLATVTYPPTTGATTCPGAAASNTSQYTYAPAPNIHLYAGGTDGRCAPLPVTAYYDQNDKDSSGNSLNGRLKSVQDAAGNTTGYAYDLATNTTTITYPDNGTATLVYDNYGDLLTSTDPLQHTTTNVYDGNHNLISTTDPLGHITTSTYDNNGNKTASTYPATFTSKNTTSTTVYNQYSEPTSTTDELGNVRTFNYDTNYNPQSVTDGLGTLASFVFNTNSTLASGAIGFDISVLPAQASQFSYDANGNMASRTDALGRTTTYTYDSLGHKLTTVAPTPTALAGGPASTTTYHYDAFGNVVETDAPLGRTTSSQFDANGNKLYDLDARGNKTSYVYDSLNRLTETDYPDGTKATKSYDFRNNVIDETDQNLNVTHHVYDQAGRQVSVTRGYGTSSASVTQYAYYDDGRKQSETDALNHTTTYTYDAAGRLTAVSGVKGNTTYAYDDAGNQVSRTDGNGQTTRFQYDARKRLVETDYPDGTSAKNSYDGPGNLASVTDQAGAVVQYAYDAANQLKTVTQLNHPNPSANTNTYGYDPLGNLTGLTDENQHTTQNLFDLYGEPVQKTLPDQTLFETRQYDAAGNLTSLTHFNGVTTTYTYDALNRLLSRTTPGEAPVGFTYTATGKRATMADGSGNTTYNYDSLDRLTTKAAPAGTLSYSYDGAGNLASISSNHANGVLVSYAYDELNRLSTVEDSRLQGSNTTTYTYDPASNVATVAYPNGLQSTFTYDQLNRVTGMNSSISGYTYTLGATGNRTQAVESTGRTINWSYDGIYRLTNETISNDPSKNNGSASYSLDPVGNRLSLNSSLPGVESGSFGYNADDEVSTETYDLNGNTLATGGKSFTYDLENHLTSMNGGTVAIIYDGDGNRVAKAVGGVTTQYLVDDLNPTGYSQVVEEVVNGAVTRQYTYGLQRISENQPISNVWTSSFYGYDGSGSVRQLTNSAGVVTDEYEYDAYGNSFTKSGTTPNNYLYRGEQYDPDLGLYYLRARYYNPNTGRFLSRDPEDGNAIDPQSLHKYLYADGDPVNMVDPRGHAAMIESLMTRTVIASPLELGAIRTGLAIAKAFCFIAKILARATLGVPPGLSGIKGPPGWPGPANALCGYFGPLL